MVGGFARGSSFVVPLLFTLHDNRASFQAAMCAGGVYATGDGLIVTGSAGMRLFACFTRVDGLKPLVHPAPSWALYV